MSLDQIPRSHPPHPFESDFGPLYRLSVEQYHQMISAGVFSDADHVELLQGLLYEKWPKSSSPSDDFYRVTVPQYHQMIAAGVLSSDDRVELLQGLLLQKMSKNSPHRVSLARAIRAISSLLPPGWSVQSQDPIALPTSEPEPDACIIRGIADDYPDSHPGPSDIALVIEVADSSLRRDRTIKLQTYAAAGITSYWIVNLDARAVEVHSNPNTSTAQYSTSKIFAAADAIPLTVEGVTLGSIPVAKILP